MPLPAIEPFGLALLVGIVCGSALAARLAPLGPAKREIGEAALFGFCVGALIGARLVYLLTTAHDLPVRGWFALGLGGLSGYGALMGGFAGAGFVLTRRGEALDPWFDAAAPGALLAVSVTRLGCFLTGCDAGTPLPSESPAWLRALGGVGTPVHPTQLYESLGALALCTLAVFARRVQRTHGVVWSLAVTGYGVLRLAVEQTRERAHRGTIGSLDATTCFALATLILVAIVWLKRRTVNAPLREP